MIRVTEKNLPPPVLPPISIQILEPCMFHGIWIELFWSLRGDQNQTYHRIEAK